MLSRTCSAPVKKLAAKGRDCRAQDLAKQVKFSIAAALVELEGKELASFMYDRRDALRSLEQGQQAGARLPGRR